MKEIRTARLLLRPFQESDYDDLFEFLSQLKDDEFEGYPGITYENGRSHLQQRLGSEAFYAVVWFHKDLKGTPVWKDTFVYAMLDTDKRGKC
ncbi:MAG: hypothetical protein IJI45_11795 [Anaerolineaceae bacterium]|nr:hypothetical protein [Anaerolineaceae bacterium]